MEFVEEMFLFMISPRNAGKFCPIGYQDMSSWILVRSIGIIIPFLLYEIHTSGLDKLSSSLFRNVDHSYYGFPM